MDPKIRIAGFIVFLGFAYAAYEFYGFYTEEIPAMVNQRATLEAQFNQKQGEYQKLRSFVQNIEAIKGELRELSLQLKGALDYMPPDFKLSELLRKLTALAQNSGVELIQFNPDPSEQKPEGAFYATSNIAFEIRGAFTQCLLFFDQISRLKRIINIVGVSMEAPQQVGVDGRTDKVSAAKVRASGTLVTFRFAE